MGNNYFDTFIAVADDSAAEVAVEPPVRATPTVATLQYQMLREPYKHRMEDVLFEVWLIRQDGKTLDADALSADEIAALREEFLAQPQPCFRTSALGKTYGWGIDFDSEGRAALFAVESAEYKQRMEAAETVVKAMRSSRKMG